MSRVAAKIGPLDYEEDIHYTVVVQDFRLPSGPIQLRCTSIFLGNPSIFTYIYTYIYIYGIYVYTPKRIYNILWNCFSFHFALFFLHSYNSHPFPIRLYLLVYLFIYQLCTVAILQTNASKYYPTFTISHDASYNYTYVYMLLS